jgi:AraC-like DNA-binding protein
MPINIVQELFQTQLDLNFIFRTIIEKYYLDAQERSYTARLGNAIEKYKYFAENKPGFSERFALIDIASYLDMKPETLQRIQRKQKLKSSDTTLLCKKLEQYLHSSQVFTQKDLTLEKLAKELNFSIHKLSWLLNNVYNVNFHTYINNYRVEHIAQVLGKLNDWQDYTIEVVALQAGFGSRSSFYGHFKRHLHSSPKDYFGIYFSEIKKKREV